MRILKPVIVLIAILLLGGVIVRTLFAEQIGGALFKAAVTKQVGRDVTEGFPDGLTVILVGTGSPVPDPMRAGPMTVVAAGDRLFIVDAGAGSGRRFGEFGLPWGKVEAAFLTHFHSDHIDGLGEVMLQHWAAGGAQEPLALYGPRGVDLVADGFNQAYAWDASYRLAHHGPTVVPPEGSGAKPFSFDTGTSAMKVYEKDGLTVTAVPVSHEPVEPAVGYRFDYKGRSVTLSGDTTKDAKLTTLAQGTDLLVHEALNEEMVATIGARLKEIGQPRLAQIMDDIPSYHTTPVAAAEVATESGAKMLVFSHLVPAVPSRALYPVFLKGTGAAYKGPIVLGEDGMVFELPAGSDKIDRTRLD
ncbi:MAG: MBL fold metallo-hydrolase [Hyphomonas sp.]|uniref:MBL fold metallo-hydrolase n=1 Tax=Hyphomonas sp. TaxID=87 RepID=UPI003529A6BA